MQAETTQPHPTMGLRTDRFLIGIIAGALALIILGVVVAALGVGRGARSLDPASPAGTVQAYADALRVGDVDQAYGLLSQAAQASWSRDRYRESYPRYAPPSGMEQRLLIETIRAEAERADVRVTISRFMPGNPLFMSTYHQEVEVHLVKQDGAWKIDRPVEPYPFLP